MEGGRGVADGADPIWPPPSLCHTCPRQRPAESTPALPPNGHLRPWGLTSPQLRCQGALPVPGPTAEPSSPSRMGSQAPTTQNSGSAGRGSPRAGRNREVAEGRAVSPCGEHPEARKGRDDRDSGGGSCGGGGSRGGGSSSGVSAQNQRREPRAATARLKGTPPTSAHWSTEGVGRGHFRPISRPQRTANGRCASASPAGAPAAAPCEPTPRGPASSRDEVRQGALRGQAAGYRRSERR